MSASAPSLHSAFTEPALTHEPASSREHLVQSAHPYKGALHSGKSVRLPSPEMPPVAQASADRLVAALVILVQQASRNSKLQPVTLASRRKVRTA